MATLSKPNYNVTGIVVPKDTTAFDTSIDDPFNYDFAIRRAEEEKRKYDAMKRAERKKMALDKLMSDEFSETLRRFYTANQT